MHVSLSPEVRMLTETVPGRKTFFLFSGKLTDKLAWIQRMGIIKNIVSELGII